MGDGRRKTFLRAWRNHSGMSLEEVAPKVGITHGTLSRIERGAVPYNQDLLERLADLYGCEPAELLIQDPAVGPNVIPIWAGADDDQRRAIATVAETIVGFRGDKRS
jgi:transcriptional regulator with XRE-family HTH domain